LACPLYPTSTLSTQALYATPDAASAAMLHFIIIICSKRTIRCLVAYHADATRDMTLDGSEDDYAGIEKRGMGDKVVVV
jgi:hypothetical protein